jgi:uncharacterized membrane protein YdjX (TVP38/TMEM64 family)
VHAIESVSGNARTFQRAALVPSPELANVELDQQLIAPKRPVKPDILVTEFLPEEAKRTAAYGWMWFAGVFLFLSILAAAWRWTPLHEWLNFQSLVPIIESLTQSAWAPFAVVAIYVLAGLAVFPVMVLIAVTGVVFGPLLGGIYAMAGAAASAAVTYWAGRLIGRETVRRLAGPRLNRLTQQLARRGQVAMSLVRVVPLAPFTIVNLVAGASLIGFRDFMLGTVIGMTPGIAITVMFVDRITAALSEPGAVTFGWLGLAIAGAIAAALWLQRIFGRPLERTSDAKL